MSTGALSHFWSTHYIFRWNQVRRSAQRRAMARNSFRVRVLGMQWQMNIFSAGRDLIQWEVTAVNPDGPYRLVMHHGRGAIVEYFPDINAAMSREAELEALLIVAGTHGRSTAGPTWVAVGGGVH